MGSLRPARTYALTSQFYALNEKVCHKVMISYCNFGLFMIRFEHPGSRCHHHAIPLSCPRNIFGLVRCSLGSISFSSSVPTKSFSLCANYRQLFPKERIPRIVGDALVGLCEPNFNQPADNMIHCLGVERIS